MLTVTLALANPIQTHLADVEADLRAHPPATLDAATLDRRERLLDVLHDYTEAGVFPHNHTGEGRRRPVEFEGGYADHDDNQPVFIDEHGTHCAVGFLVAHDDPALARGIADRGNLRFVHEMVAPGPDQEDALIAWAEHNGFTATELARIQPSYDLEQGPAWTVTVDPLTTALGFVHVQVERRIHRRVTVYAGPNFRLFSPIWADPEPYRGFGAEAGVRVFPLGYGAAPKGAWVMARSALFRLNTTTEASAGGWGSGLVGYTWHRRMHETAGPNRPSLILSVGAGVQYVNTSVGDYGTKGVLPALHTAIGIGIPGSRW